MSFFLYLLEEYLLFQIMSHISILCFLSIFPMILSQLSDNPDQLLNWCLDGKHHKSRPGPEDELYEQVCDKFHGCNLLAM